MIFDKDQDGINFGEILLWCEHWSFLNTWCGWLRLSELGFNCFLKLTLFCPFNGLLAFSTLLWLFETVFRPLLGFLALCVKGLWVVGCRGWAVGGGRASVRRKRISQTVVLHPRPLLPSSHLPHQGLSGHQWWFFVAPTTRQTSLRWKDQNCFFGFGYGGKC